MLIRVDRIPTIFLKVDSSILTTLKLFNLRKKKSSLNTSTKLSLFEKNIHLGVDLS